MIVACMSVREIKREVNRNRGLKSLNTTKHFMICHWDLDALTKWTVKRVLKFMYHFCLPLEAKNQQINAIRKILLANNFPWVGTRDLGVSSALPQYLLLDRTNQVCEVVSPAADVCVSAFNQNLSDLLKLKLLLNVYEHKYKHTHIKWTHAQNPCIFQVTNFKNQQYLKPPQFCMSLAHLLLSLCVVTSVYISACPHGCAAQSPHPSTAWCPSLLLSLPLVHVFPSQAAEAEEGWDEDPERH